MDRIIFFFKSILRTLKVERLEKLFLHVNSFPKDRKVFVSSALETDSFIRSLKAFNERL